MTVLSPIRNATDSVAECRTDFDTRFEAAESQHNAVRGWASTKPFGINVVPLTNPEPVPAVVVRQEESVAEVCNNLCATGTDGYCRAETDTSNRALCAPPPRSKLWSG